MYRNYLLIALRNLKKNKVFALINILGLAIGLASFLFIFMFVWDELQYDQYHHQKDNIYRMLIKGKKSGKRQAISPGVAAPLIRENLPEVKSLCRLIGRNPTLRYQDRQFKEEDFICVDSTLFQLFDWKLVKGNPETALEGPGSVILSQTSVRKYFGEDNPIGKTLLYENEQRLKVTGVYEDIPRHSHYRFDFAASMDLIEKVNPYALSHWGNSSAYLYLLLQNGADPKNVSQKIHEVVIRHQDGTSYKNAIFELQALTDIHIGSGKVQWEIAEQANLQTIYSFSLIAILILAIACFNFMNLSTACAGARAKEVGMRKVLGANKPMLIRQFIGESALYVLLAVIIALVIIGSLFQPFNILTGKSLGYAAMMDPGFLGLLAILILLVSLLAGSYPAFILSRFRPVTVLKGNRMVHNHDQHQKSGFQFRFRQVLVTLQFAISILLIIATLFVTRQMDYIRKKDLGFSKDQIVTVKNPYNEKMEERYDRFREAMLSNPNVLAFTASHNIPSKRLNNYSGGFRLQNQPDSEGKHMGFTSVEYDFFKIMKTKILLGRDFSKELSTDEGNAVIINEKALKMLGVKDPIGQKIMGFYNGKSKRIVGVAENMHFTSLHEEVLPMVFFVQKGSYPPYTLNFIVRISNQNVFQTIDAMEKTWIDIAPEWPFEFSFLDERIDRLYRTEQRTSTLINIFTLLAIFISFLGLFGLTLYVLESKTKEIGIRKVMGAKLSDIFNMVSREFLILLIIANVIAWPLAYLAMEDWLNNFAYAISLKPVPFIIAAFITFSVVMVTIGFQTIRSVRRKPVEALRYE
ncbi:MAG: ABC transporter permease [Bacteroidales bacterium]|nr:ABC transporter permease [Bacteroidales bacterium]